MKDDGMAKVVKQLLTRLRRAEAEIALLRRENERLIRQMNNSSKT